MANVMLTVSPVSLTRPTSHMQSADPKKNRNLLAPTPVNHPTPPCFRKYHTGCANARPWHPKPLEERHSSPAAARSATAAAGRSDAKGLPAAEDRAAGGLSAAEDALPKASPPLKTAPPKASPPRKTAPPTRPLWRRGPLHRRRPPVRRGARRRQRPLSHRRPHPTEDCTANKGLSAGDRHWTTTLNTPPQEHAAASRRRTRRRADPQSEERRGKRPGRTGSRFK